MQITETIFPEPSGNVRGVISVEHFFASKKRNYTLAIATLLVDEPTTIGLRVPNSSSVSELVEIAECLTAFHAAVQKAEAAA